MFGEFKEKLKIELFNDLPGELAHSMMMPTVRDDNFIIPTNQPSPTKSAVLILFYQDDDGHIKFPLIQRPTYNGAHSAQVSFPGGKSEKSDKNLAHTALREAEEEIGIDPGRVEVIGSLSNLFIWVSNFIVTPVIGFTNQKPTFQKDDMEVAAIIETDLYDIINPKKEKKGQFWQEGSIKFKHPILTLTIELSGEQLP